jgi:hypothetical protein
MHRSIYSLCCHLHDNAQHTDGGIGAGHHRCLSLCAPSRRYSGVGGALPHQLHRRSIHRGHTAACTAGDCACCASGVGQWRTLAGEVAWHEFQYAGNMQPLHIRMDVVPLGGARFNVYGPATQHLGGITYQDVLAFGQGVPHPAAPGFMFWNGTFTRPGVYQVWVANTTPGAISYVLSISATN